MMLTETRARRCLTNARTNLHTNPSLSLQYSHRLLAAGVRDAETLYLAASALQQLRRYAAATPLLEQLHRQYAPGVHVLEDLVGCYTATANNTALVELQADIIALDASDLRCLMLQIRTLSALDMHGKCIDLCHILVDQYPGDPEYWCMLGWHQQSCGQFRAAENSYRTALDIAPDHARAHYALAQIANTTTDTVHIDQLMATLQRTQESNWHDRASLHSALGKEHEVLGDYPSAFRHFHASAELMRPLNRYSPAVDQRVLTSAGDWTEDRLNRHTEGGWGDDRPIFIVGLPRTGSTLLDRMLSSHSEVHPAGELLCFRSAVQELCGGSSRGDFFEDFFENRGIALDFTALGKRYCELSRGAAGNTRHYTDKMPMNYFLLGLIALALPGARFIHTVRNPLDSCFSVYKQLFAPNFYNYSYDIVAVAQHYVNYTRLMERWQGYFPGRILNVSYEQLVTSPRKELSRVLDFCKLDWQESCINFHLNSAAVDTASATQVRQPLYQSSIGRWRSYREWLQPMIDALVTGGIDLGKEL